jgi:dual specificity tyrosine-phosphorylation-regulated kinase 2/3/4
VPSNVQDSSKENYWGLLESDKLLFGDRCPRGFTKLGLLGKGGIAVVWLCSENESKTKVAVKQFPRGSTQTAKVEVNMDSKLDSPHIAKLLKVQEDQKDTWLVYELGGIPLSKLLFVVKGESHNSERIYAVHHQHFYKALNTNT